MAAPQKWTDRTLGEAANLVKRKIRLLTLKFPAPSLEIKRGWGEFDRPRAIRIFITHPHPLFEKEREPKGKREGSCQIPIFFGCLSLRFSGSLS
jgi:hypothetical protein